MNELNIGPVGGGKKHSSLANLIGATAIVEAMNEMAQERRDTRIVPSKRKTAFHEKKAKRKMVQASKKRNR